MSDGYITTIKERCRMCYTCVRECPAKAIRIVEGQAEVIGERCIACGNCVQVCSQHAKQVRSSIAQVESLLASGDKVAACLAPSFPAEFIDVEYRQLLGMLRALGFDLVNEVAFGADLVARRYKDLVAANGGSRTIATTCPAIAGYVQRYFPDLVGSLAPVVSPMVATARVLRRVHGSELRVVFIGPCIAKKVEADDETLSGEIDAAMTFLELREMFRAKGVAPDAVAPGEFDPPLAGTGAIFPVSTGMLRAGELDEDLLTGQIVATHGRVRMAEAIREFSSGDLGASLLEALCCEGCIMGAGIDNSLPLFNRRRRVREFVCQRLAERNEAEWKTEMERFADLDLGREFRMEDQRISSPPETRLAEILARMGKLTPADELNCGACGYDTCREHAVAICKGLAESEMCLPYMIEKLRKVVSELEESNCQLAGAQEALVQSEKLASMGQLAAGIAHEVNNPLGIVLMYAHLLADKCSDDSAMRDDLKMIAEQADRCKRIVAGLLHFARQNKVVRVSVDVTTIPERAIRGLKLPENVSLEVEHDTPSLAADLDGEQVIQAMSNLVSNALAAMPDGGLLTIRTGGDESRVWISISDTGTGIPEANLKKIFEPFFTTKQMGKGTGLGLAVTYGIVKMHGGDVRVQSQADPAKGPTGTTFTMTLGRHG